MNCARAPFVALACWVSVASSRADEAVPVLFQSAPGRFEVAAVDSAAARDVVALADEAWRLLAAPLALPEQFSSPIFVRLVPAVEWRETAAFRVVVEAGGVVSLRMRWDEITRSQLAPRALVQALLMRLAVAQHGTNEKITAPLWLELACVGWWRTRVDAAQLDALRQESARLAPLPLGRLLTWRRGESETRALEAGAAWLLAFLQSESTRAGEWSALLGRLLAGAPAETALSACFAGRFTGELERELWWQTGWHHLIQLNTLPTLEAVESRAVVAGAARFVFARDDGGDVVVTVRGMLEHASEPIVQAERARRAEMLQRLVPALHPFYRNAGLSLVAALGGDDLPMARRAALCSTFEQDWRDAEELAAASAAALDRLEREKPVSAIN